jgi:dipeptidyl aminopeptidase/acylaminoacyl peptidase
VDWRDRFRAGQVRGATIARRNPSRGVVVSDRDGNDEAYAWDAGTGELRRLTDAGTAVIEAAASPDGGSIVYLRDETGSEFGHLQRVPFAGGGSTDLTPDVEPFAAYGVREAGGLIAALAAGTNEQHLLTIRDGASRRWPQRELVTRVLLPDDGSFIVVAEPMDGLYNRTIIRSADDGSELARLDHSLPGAVHGRSVAVALHTDGWLRPAIWSPDDRAPAPLDVEVPGDVVPTDWSTDGRTILLLELHRARGGVLLYDTETRRATPLHRPPGTPEPYGDPFLLEDGAAGVVWSDAEQPWSLLRLDSEASSTLVRVSAHERYPGTEWTEVTFPSTKGAEIQGWLLRPPGNGPWPTILYSHGGPTAVAVPSFHALCQAWADHGYALLSVNYRGSTTFGDAYREALTGDVGGVDVDDLVAGRRWLVESGIADPDLVILNGYSYGGYLTLQCMGTHPELWAGGIAGAPVADWVVSGEDQNAMLDAYDLALFGTDKAEGRDARVRASPRTHVDRFAAPVLITTPENDSRTPLRPIRLFVDDMRAVGKEVELDIMSGGHVGMGKEHWIAMMSSWLAFAEQLVARRRAADSR